jgi:HD-GYP domain-containing protein (c-di-GMP phosphodiesterase class II)
VDAEVVIKSGNNKGRAFLIHQGERVTFGRGVNCDVQLFDEGVSRRHCTVENRGDEFFLADLESSNGTYVGNRPVISCYLADGDQIRLGVVVLEFRVRGTKVLGERRPTLAVTADPTVSSGIHRKVDIEQTKIMAAPAGDAAELRLAHDRIKAIYRVSNIVNSEVEPEEVFEAIVGAVMEVCRAERVAVLLRDPNTGALDPVAMRPSGGEGDGSDISISRTIVDDVVKKGVSTLASDASTDERFKSGQSIVAGGIRSVICVPLQAQDRVLGVLYADTRSVTNAFNEGDLELMAAIGIQAGIAIQRATLLSELEDLFFGSIRTLVAAIDAKDRYTHGHSERVTNFALKIAKEMSLGDEEREIIQLAGLLHDVGKIGVPESVLNKPGDLTEEEWAAVKRHPEHGAEIIANIHAKNIDSISSAVRHHHERWDGSGYPDGLKREEAPLASRILAVADSFDAMTSDRPYRKGFSADQAAEVVAECAGTQFDPTIAQVFRRIHSRGEMLLPYTLALKYRSAADKR